MFLVFVSLHGNSYSFEQENKERWYNVSEGEFTHTSYDGDPKIVEMTSEEATDFILGNYPHQQTFIRYPIDISKLSGRDKRYTKKLRVERFSSSTVEFKVVQWQANENIGKTIETLEKYSTARSDKIDELLSLDLLTEKYAFEFKGLRQGVSMEQVQSKLGAPDFVQTYQLKDLESWFYEGDKISIFFKNSMAKEIKKVDGEYIEMIKKNYPTDTESNMIKYSEN